MISRRRSRSMAWCSCPACLPDLGRSALETFAHRYAELPRVSIAVDLPGCSNVLVDNEKGLRDLIVHLIEVHRYRRIGFIAGPEASAEAASRRRVFESTMAERGLPVDPSWVTTGTFNWPSGARAIEILFDERKVSLDALVVANDQMALSAMEALAERGIRVPQDVAIVGFDDTEMSNYVTPSLTTVRQPLRQLGSCAAEMLLAQLAGKPDYDSVVLDTEAVIRESCGCGSSLHTFRKSQFPIVEGGLESSFARGRERIVAEITALIEGVWRGGTPDKLLTALVHESPGPRGGGVSQHPRRHLAVARSGSGRSVGLATGHCPSTAPGAPLDRQRSASRLAGREPLALG